MTSSLSLLLCLSKPKIVVLDVGEGRQELERERMSECVQLLVEMINDDFPFVKYTTCAHTLFTYENKFYDWFSKTTATTAVSTGNDIHQSLIQRIKPYVSLVQCFGILRFFTCCQYMAGVLPHTRSAAIHIDTCDLCTCLCMCVRRTLNDFYFLLLFGWPEIYSRILLFPLDCFASTYVSLNPIIVQ